MKDFILLMHSDTTEPVPADLWPGYFTKLRTLGVFQGGSAIGAGETVRKDGARGCTTDHVAGYIRLQAETLTEARKLVAGNPVYEAGGSIEIRELPADGS